MPKATMSFDAFDDDIRLREGFACEKYLALPVAERRLLYQVAKAFMVHCSKMGPASALELICNLGSWWNGVAPR